MKAKDANRKKSAIIKHGVYSQRAKLPAAIKREAVFFREKIITDIAGSEDKLSGAELMLIDRTINLYGVIRMIEKHVARHGAFDGKDFRPILATNYLAYNNTLRLNLRELGIKRRVEDMLSPSDWIETEGEEEMSVEILCDECQRAIDNREEAYCGGCHGDLERRIDDLEREKADLQSEVGSYDSEILRLGREVDGLKRDLEEVRK